MATTANTASATVATMLQSYGLTFSAEQVNEWVGLLTDDENNSALILEEIRGSDQFAARFPGLSARVANGYNQITVEEYLVAEDGFRSAFRMAGLPATFYDSVDDFSNYIANNVAVPELESRIAQGYLAAQQATPEVKDALQQFYGIENTEGALAAYYLDPDRALNAIQREYEASRLAGTAKQTGFNEISRDQAERLRDIGISEAQARADFSELGRDEGVLSSNLGTGRDFTTDEKLKAKFEGDAKLQDDMRRQQEQRTAEFAGRTSSLVGNQGVTAVRRTN